MTRKAFVHLHVALLFACLNASCIPAFVNGPARAANTTVPKTYGPSAADDATNSSKVTWSEFFADPALNELIRVALRNNQELNIVSAEIELAQAELVEKQGEYLPKLFAKGEVGLDKDGRFTSQGVSDEAHGVPDNLQNYQFGLFASWEIDIWGKLRGAAQASRMRYLSSIEGQKFAVTVLVGEIANSYYELLALDAQLAIVQQNVQIQKDALVVVRLQKEAARVTELAVQRFEAEVLKTESRLFDVQQRITQTENRINFLVGRFPQAVARSPRPVLDLLPPDVHAGLPSALLENRPDVQRAALEMEAAALDVGAARAAFFPTLEINVGAGYQAFDFLKLVATPASLFYNIGAGLLAPLLNRNSLTAKYFSSNARQKQAVFNYERAILKGYIEAANQLAMIQNLDKSYALRSQQVAKLNQSVEISGVLFRSARADYMEVLLTRRDALEGQLELVETRKQQLAAVVDLYQAVGGGWR
ncbi:MAG: efflux transporter outer membrane subunit [Myxococcaceae bacterium]